MHTQGERIKGVISENEHKLKEAKKARAAEIKASTRKLGGRKKKTKTKITAGEQLVFYDRIMNWYDRKEKHKQKIICNTLEQELIETQSPVRPTASKTYVTLFSQTNI